MSRSSARIAVRLGATVVLAAATAAGGVAFSQPAVAAGTPQNYIVLAPQGQGVATAVARVQSTGGTVLASYDQIGVLVARSDRTDFATAVVGGGVQSAAATTGLATRAEGADEATVAATPDPATTSEPLWPQQWDMRAIQVAEAHSVTIGSRNVVVGVLDSGVDGTHPDLASQVDASLSASLPRRRRRPVVRRVAADRHRPRHARRRHDRRRPQRHRHRRRRARRATGLGEGRQ